MQINRKVLYFIGVLLFVALALFLIVNSVSSGGSESYAETSENTLSVEEQSNPVVTTESQQDNQTEPTQMSTSEVTIPEPISVYDYTEEELDLLARLIYSEGGIESYDTQLKIGSVVMNRVDDPYFPEYY